MSSLLTKYGELAAKRTPDRKRKMATKKRARRFTDSQSSAPGAILEPQKPKTDENIFLFVPNLIGYTRVILAAFSLSYMSYHPKACTALYSLSCLLDAVDGQAARRLGQTLKFGGVLDMITDRCATCCLLCFLSSAYPRYALLFQALITLDFSSHYIHMYSSLVAGSRSHKTVSQEHSWILWSYYNNSITLFIFCFGNEMFFICIYLMAFYHTPIGISSPYMMSFLPPALRDAIPLKIWSAIQRITLPQLLAFASFPICFGKQAINCVQFWKASKHLVDSDLEERWEKKHGSSALKTD